LHGALTTEISANGGDKQLAKPWRGGEKSSAPLAYTNLQMQGREVYKWAVRKVPEAVRTSLVAADMRIEDIDWLVQHQVST
jgi:3-oxoacyl-[acyl-carrier-protein] synthase III